MEDIHQPELGPEYKLKTDVDPQGRVSLIAGPFEWVRGDNAVRLEDNR